MMPVVTFCPCYCHNVFGEGDFGKHTVVRDDRKHSVACDGSGDISVIIICNLDERGAFSGDTFFLVGLNIIVYDDSSGIRVYIFIIVIYM